MSAVLSYGSDGQINGAAIPATDNAGNTGNALGVSVGWGHSFYYQSATAITLPAGHYDLKVYAYNNNSATQLKSLFGFVATNGTSYLSTKTSFTQGAWVTDVVSFDLTEDTEGKFQIGGQAISGGSGSNAKVFFDNITLTYTNPDQAIKDAYNNALQEAKDAIANEDYNNVTGEERSSLEDAISTYDEITSGYEEATTALKDATSAFTAAKSAYDAYVAAIQYPELPYASAEKKAAVEQACGESPATASEATEKTAAIYQALRAYYESHALAENLLVDAATEAPTAEFGNVTYGRKLVEGYNTLVLPFDVTKDELGDNVEAVYAYGGSTMEGEGENAVVHLDFTQAVENLAANTPYIVKMSADQDGLAFNEKEFKTVAEPIKSDANFDFVGTYVELPAGNDVITNRDYISAKSGLKQATDGKQLKAFRAYLKNKTEEVAGAMISITIGGEVVDGIQAAQILNNVEGTIYNLNGQKVSNAQKGIFIQNGKKVVIK